MSKFKILIFAVALFTLACENTAKNSDQEDEQPGVVSEKKPQDERILIVPGKSIGKIYIGQLAEDLGKLLGNADAGDAAMGKAWGIWYDKSTKDQVEQFAIYTTYRDTSLTAKDVKQIRTESAKFETANGLAVSATKASVMKAFPSIKLLNTYFDQKKADTIQVYDDQTAGIGFEFVKDTCKAITVHQLNKPVDATYLALHPEWKRIE